MRPRHLSAGPSSLVLRALAALVIIAGALGCATAGAAGDAPPRTTLEFDNQSSDPVRVYLVIDEGGQFLLGRVYPMQRGSLTLPRHLPSSDTRRVALVAVPLGTPSITHRVDVSLSNRAIIGSVSDLSKQRFVITPSTMHGVLTAMPTLR